MKNGMVVAVSFATILGCAGMSCLIASQLADPPMGAILTPEDVDGVPSAAVDTACHTLATAAANTMRLRLGGEPREDIRTAMLHAVGSTPRQVDLVDKFLGSVYSVPVSSDFQKVAATFETNCKEAARGK